jgi:hypothetical protein
MCSRLQMIRNWLCVWWVSAARQTKEGHGRGEDSVVQWALVNHRVDALKEFCTYGRELGDVLLHHVFGQLAAEGIDLCVV